MAGIQGNRSLNTLLRIGVTLSSAWLAWQLIDPSAMGTLVRRINIGTVGLATILQAIMLGVLALRWQRLRYATGTWINAGPSLRLTYLSSLMSLVLPTGGDTDLSGTRRRGDDKPDGPTTVASVADRLLGLGSLLLVVGLVTALGYPILRPLSLLCAAVLIAGATLLLLTRRGLLDGISGRLSWFAKLPYGPVVRPAVILKTVGLSLLAYGLGALIAYLLADAMGVAEIDFVLLFPAILLAGLIPISVGGWGVREITAVAILVPAGIAAEEAVAVTFAFGVTQLVASLIGWLLCSGQR